MGNIISEEEAENEFLEAGFNLEDPQADQKINFGTAAPNCQPKHTKVLEDEAAAAAASTTADDDDERALKHRRESSVSEGSANQQEPQLKRPHTSENAQAASDHQLSQAQQQAKKMSYIQMAKLGYQELVNAIIRPPRADYKVRVSVNLMNGKVL